MIRVMTFNLRYGDAPDGAQHWDQRKALALARINAHRPHLLGLQECQAGPQTDFVRAHLPEHAFVGEVRGGDAAALEMTPLLFHRGEFTLLARGHFWLSQTPEVSGSRDWDADFARVVTWARLRHTPTDRVLTYVNTHFDYQPLAVEESARLLGRWLQQTCAGSPVIVTGDFNVDKRSGAYQTLTQSLADALRAAPNPPADEGTFHDFGRAPHVDPLDWILVSDHFRVIEAGVDRARQGTLYASDHHPVLATLDWQASGQ